MEQQTAAAKLQVALDAVGLHVAAVRNDATRIGRTKHELQPVDPVALIGAWLAKGYVVTVEGDGLGDPSCQAVDRRDPASPHPVGHPSRHSGKSSHARARGRKGRS